MKSIRRRKFLSRAGIGMGVLLLGGSLIARQMSSDAGGPPDRDEWTLTFQDMFDRNSLDTESWGIGWGWGRTTSTSNTRIHESNVTVSDDLLRLYGTQDGDTIRSGAINTKNKVVFGPGSYLEARIQFAGREGFHNAFWSKPNSEAWPPEIDIVEQWHDTETEAPNQHSHHHLHYSSSGKPGDKSTHQDIGISYQPGDDITSNYHIFGVEWCENVIRHYVDGEPIQEWTDETMLDAMQRGAPFYMMINLNINSIGTANTDEEWTEQMLVDWVRLWRHDDSTIAT